MSKKIAIGIGYLGFISFLPLPFQTLTSFDLVHYEERISIDIYSQPEIRNLNLFHHYLRFQIPRVQTSRVALRNKKFKKSKFPSSLYSSR